MKYVIKLSYCLLIILAIYFTFNNAAAQTPGLIYKIAVNGGNKVLDPNGDGYVSKTSLGFQLVGGNRLDEGPNYSEIPFRPFPVFMDEPLADLKTGGSYGHTDFAPKVYANGKVVGSPMASYFDGRNFLFRIRLAGQSSASKGYSILIDTDNKFDGDAPNPGFEFEVLLATNFDVRVIDHRTNKTGGTILFAGSVDQYSQKSVAGSTGGGDPDYFYDFYVPISAFGGAIMEASSLRMTGVTVTSAKSGIFGVASDIGGMDDRVVKGTIVDAWKSIINNTPLTTPTDIKDTGFTPVVAFAPTVNPPLYVGSTLITGASTEAEGSVVYVYQSSLFIDSTTVGADGSWSLTVPSNLLVLDRIVTARVKPTTKSLSPASSGVTVAPGACRTTPPVITGPTNANKGLQGTTSVAGIVKLYVASSSTPIYTSPALAAGGTWSHTFGTSGGSVITGIYYATVTETNGCESGWSNQVCISNTGNGNSNVTITIPVAPTITSHTLTTTSLNVTGTAPANANIVINRNGVQLGTATANGSGAWNFTYNAVQNLAVGDYIYANTRITSPCTAISARSNTFTITGTSTPPEVTGTYCGPTTIVTGKSTEAAGTSIKVYVNGTEVGSTTVDAFETWTATIAQRTSGTITATATALNKTTSAPSAGVPISTLYSASNLAILGTESSSIIYEGSTSVRGSAPTGARITLFINGAEYVDKDGVAITTIAASNSFIFSNISPFEIYAGARLTVKANDPSGVSTCESAFSSPVTVQCNPVSTSMTPIFTEEKYCPNTPAFIRLSGSEGGVVYNIYKKEPNGSYTQFGPSVLGTGAAITLQSDPVTAVGTIVQVRTIKVGADCEQPVGGDMTVGLYPSVPKSFTVSASATTVNCPNTPVTITVQAADTQHSYQLINNITKQIYTAAIIPTSNGNLSFTPQPVAQTTEFGVVIKSLVTGCSTENTILRSVTVSGGPDVSRAVTISHTTVCTNNTVTIAVATQSGYTYRVTRKDTGTQVGSNITGDGTTRNVTTGALATGTYTYVVQVINNGSCNPFLTQEVTVQVTNSVVANAGTTQNACSSTYLSGNVPGTGTGLWTLVSKPATANIDPNIRDATKYNTEVTGLKSGTYVFNWAITSCGSTTNSQVTVIVNCASEYSVRTNKLVTDYVNGEILATVSDSEGVKSVQLLSGSLPAGTTLNTADGQITVANVNNLVANFSYNFIVKVTDLKDKETTIPLSMRFYSPTMRPGDITPLPVELASFTATYANFTVNLQWTTASEENNDRFEVERSINGKDFEKVGTVKGNGTTNQLTRYTFTAAQATSGTVYYRLKQIDFGGSYSYSKLVAVTINDSETNKPFAYPNPFSDRFAILYTAKQAGHAEVVMLDKSGREIHKLKVLLTKGNNEIAITPPTTLSRGFYIVRVSDQFSGIALKVIKN